MEQFIRAMREQIGGFFGSPQGAWIIRGGLQPLDHGLARLSGGRVVLTNLFIPTLMLTTTGAKSGQPRMVPLLYLRSGPSFVVLASNFGGASRPAWYHNLRANPVCQVQAGGPSRRCTAREAEGAEREELWRRAVILYSGYRSYAARAGGRRIPVMVLTPSA